MKNFNKERMVGLFAASVLAMSAANAGTSITLTAGNVGGCGTTWVNNVVATSIDDNGTVHGQIAYVGYRNVGSGRGGTSVQYSQIIYNAVWDVTGNLTSTSPVDTKGCVAGNGLVGAFAVPNSQSYIYSYTNGYYTVISQYYNSGNPARMRWVTTLNTP
jgi:hypothetical protein